MKPGVRVGGHAIGRIIEMDAVRDHIYITTVSPLTLHFVSPVLLMQN
jgi:hypothetical protein